MKRIVFMIAAAWSVCSLGLAQTDLSDTLTIEKEAELQGVNVTGYRKIEQSDARKSIYRLNPNLPKTIMTDIALTELPGLQKTSNGFRLMGNERSCKLLIDGIETSIDEINRLKASEVDRIEIRHVSADDSQYAGEINIIKKRVHARLLSGELAVTSGTYREYEGFAPQLSYKDGRIEMTGMGSVIHNKQEKELTMERVSEGKQETYNQEGKTSSWQYFGLLRSSYEFSKKLSGMLFYVYTKLDAKNDNSIINIDHQHTNNRINEVIDHHLVNAVLRYNISNNSRLFLKGRYQRYCDRNEVVEQSLPSSNYTSLMNEYSFEAIYKLDSIRLLNLWHEMNWGVKGIFRNNLPSGTDALRNNVYMAYVNDNLNLSNKWSLYWQLRLEHGEYRLAKVSKRETLLLPSFNLNYKLSKGKVLLSAEKYVSRPSVDYLNPDVFYTSEVTQVYGNPELNSQYNYRCALRYSQQLRGSMIGVSFSHRYSKGIIDRVYTNDFNISRYENAGCGNVSNMTLNGYLPLCDHRLNINAAIEWNYYDFRLSSAFSDKTQSTGCAGWGYGSSVNISYISSKNWFFNINGSINNRIHDLNSVTKNNPMIFFLIQKSILNDKVTFSLSGQGLLNIRQNKDYNFRDALERMNIKNNFSNFLLTVKWTFGKQFAHRSVGSGIENDDITIKEKN
jgi:hypothetical protein